MYYVIMVLVCVFCLSNVIYFLKSLTLYIVALVMIGNVTEKQLLSFYISHADFDVDFDNVSSKYFCFNIILLALLSDRVVKLAAR